MDIFSFVKSNTAILDVIQEYATLKRAGIYWKGNCPFHHERTGSFTVSPHRSIYYCFGCHAGGDVIAFIAKAENRTPIEAAQFLIERYNLEVPSQLLNQKSEISANNKERYFALCSLVAQWCAENLATSQAARTYLQERGIKPSSCTLFSLGYFPAGQQAMKRLLEAAQKQAFLAQDLVDAHIIFEGKRDLYSPFEDRIIFPIKDHLGRFCGFGGRVFRPDDTRPKYYNSHDHALFNKGSLLFGLNQAKQAIQSSEEAFLVEGYTDCIAMVQAGIKNSIATLGTACTTEHLKQLMHYANRVFVVYDGDTAGKKAIIRLAQLCWQVDLELFVVVLPEKEDPASFLQKGGNLSDIIAKAQDIFLFFLYQIGANFSQKTLHERLQAVKQILELINNLASPIKQELLLQKAATVFELPVATLKKELAGQAKTTNTQQQQQPPPQPAPKNQRPISQVEKKLISVILCNNELVTADDELLLMHMLPESLGRLLNHVLVFKTEKRTFDFQAFFQQLTPSQQEALSGLLLDVDEQQAKIEFPYLVSQLYKKQWKSAVNDVKLKLIHAQQKGDTELVQKLLAEFKNLQHSLVKRGLL